MAAYEERVKSGLREPAEEFTQRHWGKRDAVAEFIREHRDVVDLWPRPKLA